MIKCLMYLQIYKKSPRGNEGTINDCLLWQKPNPNHNAAKLQYDFSFSKKSDESIVKFDEWSTELG